MRGHRMPTCGPASQVMYVISLLFWASLGLEVVNGDVLDDVLAMPCDRPADWSFSGFARRG